MKTSFTRIGFLSTFCMLQVFASCLSAQQNGGMEDWSPSGSPPPFNWMFPTGWTTTNATSEFIGAGVTRTNDKHSGTYAAQIRTLNIFGSITRSQLGLGTVSLDRPNYQLIEYSGGEPLTVVPQQVSFFYKLLVGDSSEYAVADILIKRNESGNPYPDTVFYESVKLPSSAIYREINVPIASTDIDVETDSIVIVFSSNDTNEIALNTLFIDDVSIDFVNAVEPIAIGQDILIYPNPVLLQEIHVKGLEVKSVSVYDINGHVVLEDPEPSGNTVDLSKTNLSPGIYFVRINNKATVRMAVMGDIH